MPLTLLPHFLLRAPLLPVRALGDPIKALGAHPLGQSAVALASADLDEALGRARLSAGSAGKKNRQLGESLSRYARRAAFRPTPHGLLAGVAMGTLGARTDIHTASSEAHIAPSWSRLAALGRAWLDTPEVRARVRVRVAPSVVARGPVVAWLGLADEGLEVRHGDLEPTLDRILSVAREWVRWSELLRSFEVEGTDVDEYLLVLIDQGVLVHDLCPPIVGPPPVVWMKERLKGFGAVGAPLIAEFSRIEEAAASGDLRNLRAALAGLPGDQVDVDVHAVLVHQCKRPPRLSGGAVERAASIAPLLFRLNQALGAPIAERDLNVVLKDKLAGIAEIFGAGAFDVASLALGEFGTSLADLDEPSVDSVLAPRLLPWLTERIIEALGSKAKSPVIQLDADELAAQLADVELPPTFELVMMPAKEPPRAPPGTGWMLGLHAPAGSSWGRFSFALGASADEAMEALVGVEAQARPNERFVDVAYAPSPALADLCQHPPAREAALGLVGWSEGETLGASELQLVLDGDAQRAPTVRTTSGEGLVPSPLHRVRSTTAPGGVFRALAGQSFYRQHAPWAVTWGSLSALPRLPRVELDGFVIAPASWRIPEAATWGARDWSRWRRQQNVPQLVQVGEGDELLLVDLDAEDAPSTLGRQAGGRAFEIWPPFDRLPDKGGRRVEVVAMVADIPDEADRAREARRSKERARVGRVASPAEGETASGWTTYKLFGAEERQDVVLLALVGPVVTAGIEAVEIDRWFFMRYAEGRGARPHLRLRVHASSEKTAQAFHRRVLRAARALYPQGDLVAVETAPYFPEIARYGGSPTYGAIERIFEIDSVLAIALTEIDSTDDAEDDRVERLVRRFDALARGLGLSLPDRLSLASDLRSAIATLVPETAERRDQLDKAYRSCARRLASALSGESDRLSAAFGAYVDRLAALGVAPSSALRATLPALFHVCAVRALGPDRDAEQAACVFWQRALEGMVARGARNLTARGTRRDTRRETK